MWPRLASVNMVRPLLLSALLCVPFAASAQNLPEGAGKESFASVCSECHALDLATTQKRTKEAWAVTVDSMAKKGANASKQELAAIVDYLAKNFGESAPAFGV